MLIECGLKPQLCNLALGEVSFTAGTTKLLLQTYLVRECCFCVPVR